MTKSEKNVAVIEEIAKKTNLIFKKYGVEKAGVFGSYARGEANKNSDVDILVSMGNPIGIYKFIGLKFDLEEVLGRKVDLISSRAVNKYIKPYIEKDIASIYEK